MLQFIVDVGDAANMYFVIWLEVQKPMPQINIYLLKGKTVQRVFQFQCAFKRSKRYHETNKKNILVYKVKNNCNQ